MNALIKPQTLKGFRDFLPEEAAKRQYVIDIIRKTFEVYGFEPLETPALEYEEILLGKYGEEGDKLMYRFTDLGGRKVALRYDQTVPLARVVSQYQNDLPIPFKRYQIQPVWRAENTQRGRFREFLQCDADIVGSSNPLSDAEILLLANKCINNLKFKKFRIKFNNREILFEKIKSAGISENLILFAVRALDKIQKIGWTKVKDELIKYGIDQKKAAKLNKIFSVTEPNENKNLSQIWEICSKWNIPLSFDLTLARGLDYYTGLIFEIEIEGYSSGSVCGGGRYDNLIGMFAGKKIPAVGFAFGFDRLIEAMNELNLFPQNMKISPSKVLVTVFDETLLKNSLRILKLLRDNSINSEIYLNTDQKLDKQLKYADKKGIPYAVIIGPNEVESGIVTIKNMREKKQETMKVEKLIEMLTK